MKAMKVATQKKKAMPLKAMAAAMKAMKDNTATRKIAVNRGLRDALKAAAPPKAQRNMESIREAAKTLSQVAAVARSERRAMAASQHSGPASGPSQRARDVDTTAPPPDDAVWWFADTRGVKSVWAVAWNYKGKIQQVMYKED